MNASYATQRDAGKNPLSYRVDYYAVDASVPVGTFTLLLGYELLGSDDGRAGFSTPLATLHKFQGFTDLFLNTPANGVEDLYATVSTTRNALSLSATWHRFTAARGGMDYGSEWSLIAGYRFTTAFSAELKYADYESEGFAVDTRKLWLTLNLAL